MIPDLAALAGRAWDVAVVGGGIYGICAVREAARRGLTACLIERGDFMGATSSNSLKVMHGGLRYLQHADLGRMRESIRERRQMLRFAPHLVRPLPFLLPTHGHGLRGKLDRAERALEVRHGCNGRSPRVSATTSRPDRQRPWQLRLFEKTLKKSRSSSCSS